MITWIGKGRGLIQDSDREECVHGVVSINLQAQKNSISTATSVGGIFLENVKLFL